MARSLSHAVGLRGPGWDSGVGISGVSLYGKVSAMCSREVVFTTVLFIDIGPTSESLSFDSASAPTPSPPYCLVAPGRKTVTALEFVVMLLPLPPVVVPANVLVAADCVASRCSIAG